MSDDRLRAALEIIANPESYGKSPEAIGVQARNIARAALDRERADPAAEGERERLREALHDCEPIYEGEPGHPPEIAYKVPEWLALRIDAALAANVTIAPALDVERLAEALENVSSSSLNPGRPYPRLDYDGAAEDIAAEYARLAGAAKPLATPREPTP